MDRRQFLAGSAAATSAAALSAHEATALEAIFRQPVVVDTKAGAAGAVGAQVAASARPDGYTLLSHNNGLAGYAEVDKLFGRQPKTTRADFIPLARLAADPVLLLVNDQQ